jgi:hypothetical protein
LAKSAHSLLISADYKRLDRTDFALAYVAFRFLRCPHYESLDHAEQEYAVKRLEAALKAFGPGFHVYQYLFT